MTDVADVTEAVVTESTKGQDPSLPPPPEAQRGQTTVAPAVVERLAVKAAGQYREEYPRRRATIVAEGELRARLEPRSATVWIAGPGRSES